MCVADISNGHHHHQTHGLDRRSFVKAAAAATVAGAAVAAAGPAATALAVPPGRTVVDLTHRLVKSFPSFFGPQALFDEVIFDYDPDGFFSKEWTVLEHIGTHIDTPGHFSQGMPLVDQLEVADLVAPLAVIDIKDKATADPNATVEVDDLLAYEDAHGRIPRRALVAMNSGWAEKVDDGDEFRGGVGFPDLNFPGFSFDAADWLVTHRNIVGIAVDTMSLDPGNSADFAVHFGFLASGRYGIESLANLDAVPAAGGRAFIGAIPWEDGSGSPCRVLALV